MRIAFALVGAPLLALADQVIAMSLVGWSCAHAPFAVHVVHLPFLAATVVAAVLALALWRNTPGTGAADRERFLAGIATASATLSALAIVAMGLPAWMISPCNS